MAKSSNWPTPENPLILVYRGGVPALKNRREPGFTEDGVRIFQKNKEVRSFLARIENALLTQVDRLEFDRIPMPNKVAAWVDITFFLKAAHGIPRNDGDNAYTTIQETWQPSPKGGIADIIDDDRQVMSAVFDVHTTPVQTLQGAKAYLWVQDDTPFRAQLLRFLSAYEERRDKAASEKPGVCLPAALRTTETGEPVRSEAGGECDSSAESGEGAHEPELVGEELQP